MQRYKLEITRPYSYQIQVTVLKKVLNLFWTTETSWIIEKYGDEQKMIAETIDMIEKFKSMYKLEEPDIIGSVYGQKIS